METRKVTAGMRNVTVELDGTECPVKFSDNYRCFEVLNDSDDDVTVSIYKGKKAGEDGVITVHAGMAATLAHMRTNINTVYVTGSGTVQVAAKDTAAPVFKVRARGGDDNANVNLKVGGKRDNQRYESGWAIQTNGVAIRDGLHAIAYYAVTPYSAIYVKAQDHSNDCKFVWLNTDNVSATDTRYNVGDPVTEARDGFVTVPKGATYIGFSQLKTDIETGVYKIEM